MEQAVTDASTMIEQGDITLNVQPPTSAAVKLVVGDFTRSEEWLNSKQWGLRWRESQARYEPMRDIQFWDGTTVPRSSLNVFAVAQVVQSINAKVMEGLFSDDPPFIISPRKGTGAEEARAISALLHYQVEDCDLRQEIEDGSADAILFGTAIWKANWKETTKLRRTYTRKAQPVTLEPTMKGGEPTILHTKESDEIWYTDKEVTHGRPVLEQQDLFQTYVSPGCRRTDIRKAKYVISRITISEEELDEMRDWEGYDIPTVAELESLLWNGGEHVPLTQMETQQSSGPANVNHQAQDRFLPDTVDPTQDSSKFEIIERWDNNRVIAVLNRKYEIRNEPNPFHVIPYFSVGWWRVPNSFYSMGIGITAGDEQEIQRGVINAMLDEVSWNLNLPILQVKGDNVPTQNIRMSLGKFVPVDDVEKSMKQMPRLQAVPEAYAEIQASQARIEASSGANEMLVQGATPSQGRTSMGRTATGANLLAGGSGSRLEAFVERLSTQVFIPALNLFFEMDKQLMEMEEIRDILEDELFDAYEGDHLDLLNARVRFDVLAASRMVARQRMAQSLPMLAQTLLTDPLHQMLQIQGKKISVDELCNMWFDIAGWKNKTSLVVDMTDDDKQRLAAQQPGNQQIATNNAKIQAQTQSKLQVQDSDNAARAYREIQRQVIQQQLKTIEETGNPSPNEMG